MKVEKEVRYLPKQKFNESNPIRAKIVGYSEDSNGKFKDKNLILQVDGVDYKMTIWGDNFNRLIKVLGDDTDSWINKAVSIMKQEVLNGGVQYVITPDKN